MKQRFNVGSMSRVRGRKPLDSNQVRFPGGKADVTKAFSRPQALFNENFSKYAGQNVVVTPGYLRLETGQLPSSAISQLSFQTLATSGVQTSTERRLKLADKFTVTGFSVYIGFGAIALGSTALAGDYARQRLLTYPNPNVAQIGSNADEWMSLYNGFVSLRIDTTTFIDSVPLMQFYRVGTSQQVTAAPNQNGIARDEWPLSLYGSREALPSIDLDGKANIEWTITLPSAFNLAALTPESNFTNVVLILTGFLNQGASGMK